MPVIYVSGDPLLTGAQALAFGCNAAGKTETGTLAIQLLTRYPAAFAVFSKLVRKNEVKAGGYWLWRESRPQLVFMVVRETAAGATRLRYVEAAMMTLARDYRLDLLKSLAIAPLIDNAEWSAMRPLIEHWFGKAQLPVVVYERYLQGVRAEEQLIV
ncbi:MAG: hypothetical protein HXY40_00560 [Chloroflexi bacterium]|nr:hypothetical protein [Chloroflexota bacterium]